MATAADTLAPQKGPNFSTKHASAVQAKFWSAKRIILLWLPS